MNTKTLKCDDPELYKYLPYKYRYLMKQFFKVSPSDMCCITEMVPTGPFTLLISNDHNIHTINGFMKDGVISQFRGSIYNKQGNNFYHLCEIVAEFTENEGPKISRFYMYFVEKGESTLHIYTYDMFIANAIVKSDIYSARNLDLLNNIAHVDSLITLMNFNKLQSE